MELNRLEEITGPPLAYSSLFLSDIRYLGHLRYRRLGRRGEFLIGHQDKVGASRNLRRVLYHLPQRLRSVSTSPKLGDFTDSQSPSNPLTSTI